MRRTTMRRGMGWAVAAAAAVYVYLMSPFASSFASFTPSLDASLKSARQHGYPPQGADLRPVPVNASKGASLFHGQWRHHEPSVRQVLSYWTRGERGEPTLPLPPKPDTDKFVFFESDPGGFNNMRMAFEFIVAAVSATERTLVLPPPEGWYLLDWGPMNAGSKDVNARQWLPGGTSSSYPMFFDLAALRRMLPVLTFAEFQEKHGAAKGLDLATATSFANVPDRVAWKKWLTEHASVHRNGETSTGGVGMGACQATRNAVRAEKPDMLFLAVHNYDVKGARDHRVFGCACGPASPMREGPGPPAEIALLREHVHYSETVLTTAAAAVAKIGAYGYVAAHLRRNDFQYTQAGEVGQLAAKFEAKLGPGEPLYIATDEVDSAYLEAFKAALPGHVVWSARDFPFGRDWAQLANDWRRAGLVEQMICLGARHFYSMPSSTYSGHIVTMRQYMAATTTELTLTHESLF